MKGSARPHSKARRTLTNPTSCPATPATTTSGGTSGAGRAWNQNSEATNAVPKPAKPEMNPAAAAPMRTKKI